MRPTRLSPGIPLLPFPMLSGNFGFCSGNARSRFEILLLLTIAGGGDGGGLGGGLGGGGGGDDCKLQHRAKSMTEGECSSQGGVAVGGRWWV